MTSFLIFSFFKGIQKDEKKHNDTVDESSSEQQFHKLDAIHHKSTHENENKQHD